MSLAQLHIRGTQLPGWMGRSASPRTALAPRNPYIGEGRMDRRSSSSLTSVRDSIPENKPHPAAWEASPCSSPQHHQPPTATALLWTGMSRSGWTFIYSEKYSLRAQYVLGRAKQVSRFLPPWSSRCKQQSHSASVQIIVLPILTNSVNSGKSAQVF